jgi:hypothetical protein
VKLATVIREEPVLRMRGTNYHGRVMGTLYFGVPWTNLGPETTLQAVDGLVQYLRSNGGMVSSKIRNDHFIPHPSFDAV